MKLHRDVTKQLQTNAHATEREIKATKAATAAATKQRLAADVSKTHKAIHADAVARAHNRDCQAGNRETTGDHPVSAPIKGSKSAQCRGSTCERIACGATAVVGAFCYETGFSGQE